MFNVATGTTLPSFLAFEGFRGVNAAGRKPLVDEPGHPAFPVAAAATEGYT